MAEPLQRRSPDFTKLTGAKVNVVTVPNAELYQKALADLATGTNSYDGFLFAPSWIVDFAPAGYLEDLTERVKADTALKWDDVAPFFRDFNSYQGKVYSIPLDGDFHMVYYRSDILAQEKLEPPKTWDDYLNIAKTLNGKDLNGDGKPDYGSCIAKAKAQQSYWWITEVAPISSMLALLFGTAAAYGLVRFEYRPRVGAIVSFIGCVILAIIAVVLSVPWEIAVAAGLGIFVIVVATIGRRFKRSLGNDDIAFWMISQRMLPPIAVVIPIYILFQRLNLLDTRGLDYYLCGRQLADCDLANARLLSDNPD